MTDDDEFSELTPIPRDLPREAAIVWLRVTEQKRRADKHSREIEAIKIEAAKAIAAANSLDALQASLAKKEESGRVDRRWIVGISITLVISIAGAALSTRDSVKGLEREVELLKQMVKEKQNGNN